MNNESLLLLRLISENKSLNEISSILGLSNKQIHMRLSMLRNSGYLFDREYFYNGEINYLFHNPLTPDNDIPIIKFPENENIIKVMLVSDTHLGHINDSIECIDSMYNYCAKEGIHIILHAGDFFEGIFDSRKKLCKFTNAEDQISYGLKKYPYDKNILNFILLGNHDATFMTEAGIDIKNVILDRRPDLIPIGYGYSYIVLKNYMILIRHQKQNIKIKNPIQNNIIYLYGHSHSYSANHGDNTVSIHIPSLSFTTTSNIINPLPSMIEMTLRIKNNYIYNEDFKQFIFDNNNNPICISNINYNIPIKETILDTQNERIIPNLLKKENCNVKKTKIDYKNMSQIEKFNARYNISDEKDVKSLIKK